MSALYFDYNATTPIAPAVQEAMLPFLTQHYGNPSSNHVMGRAAHEAVEEARGRMARLLGAEHDEIVFTSGGTEANNLAIKGLAFRRSARQGGHLVISVLEHPAVVEPARFLERLGFHVTIVGCDRKGIVDPDEVRRAIQADTFLVSIMLANNEIGTLQPLAEISDVCRERGVSLQTDAAQAIAKVSTFVDELGVDLLSIAGHKMYAPKGVGALYVRKGIVLEPHMHGAGHEGGLRAGTENVPYIVGLGQAALMALRQGEETRQRMQSLRDRLLDKLRDAIGSSLGVNGEHAPRLPNTLSANFPDVVGAELLARCPELCASTGSACHSGTTHMSATLAAIGLTPDVARGVVRLSLGWQTTAEEVDRAADLLIAGWKGLR